MSKFFRAVRAEHKKLRGKRSVIFSFIIIKIWKQCIIYFLVILI